MKKIDKITVEEMEVSYNLNGNSTLKTISWVERTLGYFLRDINKESKIYKPLLNEKYTEDELLLFKQDWKEYEKNILDYSNKIAELRDNYISTVANLVTFIDKIAELNKFVPEQYRQRVKERALNTAGAGDYKGYYNHLLDVVDIFIL